MTIHIYNPPEPCANPTKRCGSCTGVPRYWKLTIPDYVNTPTGTAGVDYPKPGVLFLERGTQSDNGLKSGTYCYWQPMNRQRSEMEQTAENFPFAVEFNPLYSKTPHPFGSMITQLGWKVWIADFTVNAVTYYRVQYDTFAGAFHNTPANYDFFDEEHWNCLGENRMWWESAMGAASTTDAELSGWPINLFLEPWYP